MYVIEIKARGKSMASNTAQIFGQLFDSVGGESFIACNGSDIIHLSAVCVWKCKGSVKNVKT